MRHKFGHKSFGSNLIALILLVLVVSPVLLPLNSAFGFELKGFSDITFNYTRNKQDTTDPNTNGSFVLGQFDLYVSETIGERVDFLSELVIEGEGGEFNVDLERLQIGYLFSDELFVRAGRFHNLLGYWNMVYHHGAQLQTTIERPEFLKFEDDGGVLQTHLVGMWIGGSFRTSSGFLQYGVMGGNGAKTSDISCPTVPICTPSDNGTLDPNSVGDNSKNKAITFHLHWMPSVLRGVGLGISANFSQIQFFDLAGNQVSIATTSGVSREVGQQVYGVDLEYLSNNIELLSEFYQIRDHGVKTFLNYAWYVQTGYKFADYFTPYARIERMTVHGDDPYFVALGSQDFTKTIFGIRYDIISTSSLKAEVRFVNQDDNFNEYAIQWAFAF